MTKEELRNQDHTENLTAPAGPSLAYLLSVKNHKIWISKSLKIEISTKIWKLDMTKEKLRNQDHTGNLARRVGPPLAYLLSVKNHKIWMSNNQKISNNSYVKNCHNSTTISDQIKTSLCRKYGTCMAYLIPVKSFWCKKTLLEFINQICKKKFKISQPSIEFKIIWCDPLA